MDYVSVGQNIRTHRKSLDWSQSNLADYAELSPAYVSRVERGQKQISLEALLRIADALGVTANDLIYGCTLQYKEGSDIIASGCTAQEKVILSDIAKVLMNNLRK